MEHQIGVSDIGNTPEMKVYTDGDLLDSNCKIWIPNEPVKTCQ